ncbi:MAG: NAD(P)-dependent oxidoreductase [Candidatus Latescibacterota bacterium]|nr:NAD(P)-dependent oxidoreductase [Candidatus Latescibacterota bacterium]
MAKRLRVVVPGDDPVQIGGSPHLERLKVHGDVIVYDKRPENKEEQIERAKNAQIIINSRGVVTWREEDFQHLPDIEMIATCSIGTDMIDLVSAKKRGIVVSNQPGRTAPVVAEHMFGLMFSLAKRAHFQTSELKSGRWTRQMNVMLQKKVLGIIGTGAIGAEMARLGRAIGMEVMAWTFNPSSKRAEELGVRYVDLDELLRLSDVVSLHVKLTPDSHHLISIDELKKMKKTALLLNGARGDVLDLDALCGCLNAGDLGGAGLDVFPEEPLPSNHPILACDQIVLTPHAADQTPEGVELLNGGAVENVLSFIQGAPKNNVAI